jgi:hypothetical protein
MWSVGIPKKETLNTRVISSKHFFGELVYSVFHQTVRRGVLPGILTTKGLWGLYEDLRNLAQGQG